MRTEEKGSIREYKGCLTAYVRSITARSRNGMYICPLCGSGTRDNMTGALSIKDGESWKCFSCGRGGDIFDLMDAYEGTSSWRERFRRAAEIRDAAAGEA